MLMLLKEKKDPQNKTKGLSIGSYEYNYGSTNELINVPTFFNFEILSNPIFR